ncbi:hypothetical protein [Jannaschia sp. CCS1]|uniref:hypothetical protein n=1 Tax=Jannaschia sp. (strain CCS1) TaxID=290400 RepID=UPI000053D7F5|nr:hypothetical protein [Jannaschia sp. CCS1]ABD53877.1 hypothetical protein Jann_0960 [Jannaschia sp. CCS1]
MFKGPRGLLVTLLGAGLVIAAAFIFGFQGQKDDTDTSRAFLTHAAAGEMTEAHTLLHTSIAERHSVDDLTDILAGMDVYSTISFPSISFSASNGSRSTELTGTGTTDSGCESALRFDLLDGEITFFDITPLCRGGARDA